MSDQQHEPSDLERENAELRQQLADARAQATSPQAPAAAVPQGAAAGPPTTVQPGPAELPHVEADLPELPKLPRCPRCNVGYLYVVASDEEAAHEVGQRLYAPYMRSGGSVTRHCFNCDWNDTVAIAPTTAPVNPLPEG